MILKVKQDINQQEADRSAAEFSHQEHPDTWQCVDVRDLLFEILERRLGPVPETTRETIMAITDKHSMIRQFRKSFQASSMESFVALSQQNGS
jgi:hypothetical protein